MGQLVAKEFSPPLRLHNLDAKYSAFVNNFVLVAVAANISYSRIIVPRPLYHSILHFTDMPSKSYSNYHKHSMYVNGKPIKSSEKPEWPNDGKLTLYAMRFCPYSHRVHLMLRAKKLPYRTVNINVSNKPEWFAEINDLKQVPVLQLADERRSCIPDSLVICGYLEEAYPKVPLMPKDPLTKAMEAMWIFRFNTITAGIYQVFQHGIDTPKKIVTQILDGLDLFEQELRKRKTMFFGGDMPGMLDFMIWPWCERTSSLELVMEKKLSVDKKRFGQLLKWRIFMIEDVTVKSCFLNYSIHATYIKSCRHGKPNYTLAN